MPIELSEVDFGNEAGDDAILSELAEYFVEQREFKPFLDKDRRLLVATAKKGVGKSALIQWTYYNLKLNNNVLVVKCRGADLTRDKFKITSNPQKPNDFISDWVTRICSLINRTIASEIKFAFDDTSISLVEAAEIDGYKQKNLLGCLIDRFTKSLEKLGVGSQKIGIQNELEALKRFKKEHIVFLVDDLDATFQNTKEERVELSTFFSACRYIFQDIEGISFRVTMRSDVWSVLRRFDESLDKVEQYVSEIKWSESDWRKILFKRLEQQYKQHQIPVPLFDSKRSLEEKQEALINHTFSPRVFWDNRDVMIYKIIYTLSYQRPRWGIQLCKLAQKNAIAKHRKVIEKVDVDEIWGEFGRKRIADLVAEHKHQCSQIEELVSGFRGSDRRLEKSELLMRIQNQIVNHINVIIEGESGRNQSQVAHFLYRIGFILARSENEDGSYIHYSFEEMPDFLTSRSNDDFGVSWEIHPCYREALDIKKVNRSEKNRQLNYRASRSRSN